MQYCAFKNICLGDRAVCSVNGTVIDGEIELISKRGINVANVRGCTFVKWDNVKDITHKHEVVIRQQSPADKLFNPKRFDLVTLIYGQHYYASYKLSEEELRDEGLAGFESRVHEATNGIANEIIENAREHLLCAETREKTSGKSGVPQSMKKHLHLPL